MNRPPGAEFYTDAEWYALTHDEECRPRGAELRRIRLELRELCLLHCPYRANDVVIPTGPPTEQLELFHPQPSSSAISKPR